MEKHFSGKGSQVTRKYPPVKVERIIPCYNKAYGLTVEKYYSTINAKARG